MRARRDPNELLPLTPLSLAVLLALADGARHGYAILKELERQAEPRVVTGAGTLSAALERMLGAGLVAESEGADDDGSGGPRRRYFALTPFGRDVARAELLRMAQLIAVGRAKRLVPELRLSVARGTA